MNPSEAPAIPWLTILTLIPLVGSLLVAGVEPVRRGLARALGLILMGAALGLVIFLWSRFDATSGLPQFVERHDWIPSVNVQYHLGVDGLGLSMVLLAALLVPFGLLASGGPGGPGRGFVALLLLLQAGLFGSFTALNFIHWFLFWEISLVPAYFLIKLWGGAGRTAAANQFFVYTMVGSVALLLSMLAVQSVTGTFDFLKWAEIGRNGELESLLNLRIAGWYGLSSRTLALVIFAGAFLGFAVKVPVWPFHTWLPATYAEAPTGVSMLLTGVMSKMGVYGLLRLILPLFPEQMRWVQGPLLWLAIATIVLGAWAALAQRDLKRIVAYSSINHLGYCLLGIFASVSVTGGEPRWATAKAAALGGVVVQMFAHGLSAAALFYLVGRMEVRTGRRGLDDFGGLRAVAPVFCGLMGAALFASLGLPGLGGFIGEFLIFQGAFPLAGWAAALSLPGLLVTAVFLLTILQRVWSGPVPDGVARGGFADLDWKERLVVLPSLVLLLALGVSPQWLMKVVNPTVLQWVEGLKL